MKNQIIILFILYNTLIFSQPSGSLDPSFGNGVIVILNDYQSIGSDLEILNDGKILVAGSTNNAILLRFNQDGSLDNSFVATNSNSYIGFSNLEIQSDNKILVGAGDFTNVYILRYNVDGSLDSSFGSNGSVTVNINLSKIKIDISSNKIVIGGVKRIGTNDFFAIARYNMDGSIDNSFNGNGLKIVAPNYSTPRLTDIQIDLFSRISACGSYHFDSNYYSSFATNNWLCRVNSDGSMDTSFSDDGLLTVENGTYFNEKFNESNAMLLKSNGSLLVAGTKGVDPYFGRDFSLHEVSQLEY